MENEKREIFWCGITERSTLMTFRDLYQFVCDHWSDIYPHIPDCWSIVHTRDEWWESAGLGYRNFGNYLTQIKSTITNDHSDLPQEEDHPILTVSAKLELAIQSLCQASSIWFDQQPGLIQKPRVYDVFGGVAQPTCDDNASHLARIGAQINALKEMVNMLDNFLMSTQILRGE